MQKKNPNNKKKLKVSNSDILKELKKSKLKKPLKQIKPQKSIKKTEMLFTAEIIAYNILDKIPITLISPKKPLRLLTSPLILAKRFVKSPAEL